MAGRDSAWAAVTLVVQREPSPVYERPIEGPSEAPPQMDSVSSDRSAQRDCGFGVSTKSLSNKFSRVLCGLPRRASIFEDRLILFGIQPTEHRPDRRYLNHRRARCRGSLVVAAVSPPAPDPSVCPFDHPALRPQDEALVP